MILTADVAAVIANGVESLKADNERLRLEIEERRKHTATMMLVAEDGAALAIADLAECNGLAAFAEMVRADKWRQRCRDCGNSIDFEMCQCGSAREHDAAHEGHSFVPMGCECNYADWPTLSKGKTMSTDDEDDGYLAWCAEMGKRHIGHPDNQKPTERACFCNPDGNFVCTNCLLMTTESRAENGVETITDKAIRLEAENRHLRIEIGELRHEMETQEDRVVLSIADWLRASNQVALAGQVQSGAWQPIHDCGHVRGHEQDGCPCCGLGSK